MSSLRRYALVLAATAPLAACGSPPPTAGTDNQVGSMGAPAIDPAAEPAAPTNAATVPPPVQVPGNAAGPVDDARLEADYIGKWIGPEGLVLEVKAKPGGGVTVVNQWSLDDKGTFEGSVTAEGLRFVRNGTAVTASPTDGDGTGMKWLAGKKDCLVVTKNSEGYCRA